MPRDGLGGTPGAVLDERALRIEVVSETQGFAALEAEWNALLQASASNNVFLTWEWMFTWWQVYGAKDQLYVLTARDWHGTLLGVAPLKRVGRKGFGFSRLGLLEFIGSGGDVTPEYLDFIVRRGSETDVVRAFASHICADPLVWVLDLQPFAAHSPHVEQLTNLLSVRKGRVHRIRHSLCPVLNLPASEQEFMAGRSRNYRKKIGEYERRCERDLRVQLRSSVTADEVRNDLAALIDLHHKRWRNRSRAFRSASYLQFHRQLAVLMLERGWIRLFCLETGSTPVAALYCFAYDHRYYFYQSGRDPRYDRHRVGLVLMHKVIKTAIRERATVFDFLRGEEEYKFRWAASTAENLRIVYSKSFAARVSALSYQLGRFLSDRLRLPPAPPEGGGPTARTPLRQDVRLRVSAE